MPHQLIRRAINVSGLGANPGGGTHANISPSGDAIFIANNGFVPTLFKWNGSSYEPVSTPLSATNYVSGVWTEDENFLILQQNATATAWQVWSYDKTTGAIAQLNSQNTTVVPSAIPAVLQRLSGDYFIHYRTNNAAGSVRVMKLDRTTSPPSLSIVATYAISVVEDSLQGPSGIVHGKNAFVAPKRRGTAFDLALFVFNPTAGTLTLASQVDPGLTATPRGITVTRDGLNFHSTGANLASARSGKIASDLSALTLTDVSIYPGTTSISKGIYVSQYVFADSGLFYANTGTPYDRYNVVSSDGTIAPDTDGAILNMDSVPNSFSQNTAFKMNDVSILTPRIHLFMQNNANVPVLTAYREVISNTQSNLFAQGVMGDAFARLSDRNTRLFAQGVMGDAWSTYREFDNLSLLAQGVMGDAISMMNVEDFYDLVASGVMGDATMRGTSEQTSFVAEGIIGDAWATALVEDNVSFSDTGLMGDALSLIQVNDAYSLIGIGPVADAFAVMSDENINLIVLAPMGDAFSRLSDERVDFFALGPMGEAVFLSEESSISSTLEAFALMGDAFAATTADFVDITATGPMGDAAIGILQIPRGCRRRNMMVQNVI